MAISKSKKPISLIPLHAFINMFLMVLIIKRVDSADSLSFTLDKFDAEQEDLIFQGDATTKTSGNVLQLTKVDDSGKGVQGSMGRALYYAPVHLWKKPQLVSSFETTFTFSISSSTTAALGDGLAFFIASPDAVPGGGGGDLGLFPPSLTKNSSSSLTSIVKDAPSSEPLVAVEFDTFYNAKIGDPKYHHIGIDINSITSVTTTEWDWQDGKIATAQISYNSASKRLTVVASYPDTPPLTLSYDVDLFAILPQWVRVGFSAATGAAVETNTILSWSFTSTLRNNIKKENMHYGNIVM